MGLHRHDALLGFQRPDDSRHGAAIADPQTEHRRPGDLQVEHLQAVEPMAFTQIVDGPHGRRGRQFDQHLVRYIALHIGGWDARTGTTRWRRSHRGTGRL